jgi:hypothetical protein
MRPNVAAQLSSPMPWNPEAPGLRQAAWDAVRSPEAETDGRAPHGHRRGSPTQPLTAFVGFERFSVPGAFARERRQLHGVELLNSCRFRRASSRRRFAFARGEPPAPSPAASPTPPAAASAPAAGSVCQRRLPPSDDNSDARRRMAAGGACAGVLCKAVPAGGVSSDGSRGGVVAAPVAGASAVSAGRGAASSAPPPEARAPAQDGGQLSSALERRTRLRVDGQLPATGRARRPIGGA